MILLEILVCNLGTRENEKIEKAFERFRDSPLTHIPLVADEAFLPVPEYSCYFT